MKTNRIIALALALYSLPAMVDPAHSQGTAFTYQGQLQANGSPAGGSYDFTFALFNNNTTNGSQIGNIATNLGVSVTNGIFTVLLDFGTNFPGASRWLAIAVRPSGDGSFIALNPLQELTPTPYAIYAPNAGSATTATTTSDFSGALSGDVTGGQNATVVSMVGGQPAVNIASGASAANAGTSLDTAGTLVKRDGSGNFAAGTITANLAGAAVLASNLPNGIKITNAVITNSSFWGNGGGLTNLAFTYTGVSNLQQWEISQRSMINLAVPSFRSTAANSVTAVDTMPNGSASDAGNGLSWLDVCDADILQNQNPVSSIHLGARANWMEIDSSAYNGATQKPLYFGLSGTPLLSISTGSTVGVNTTNPVDQFDVMNNVNGIVVASVINTNAGASAIATLEARISGAYSLTYPGFCCFVCGYGYATVGAFKAAGVTVDARSDLTNGMSLVTEANAPISFYTGGYSNQYLRGSIGASGPSWLGTDTASNGFASFATNTYVVSPTGYTNTGTKTVRIPNFAGVSVNFSNSISKISFSLGTVTSQLQILQPNESLTGTSCSGNAVDF